MSTYTAEEFTSEEANVLRRYFTNLDGPVFALVNLPEVVKGALFARYSRSPKSLRRLFLDEFVGDLDIEGDATFDATVGLQRAEQLYDRIFFEYGDDSVAQLGGVHLACEQASNLLTKVLEWGRLMAYLEQSTRYISYDSRIGGRYRYYRDPDVLGSDLGLRYVGDLDRLFDTYAEMAAAMVEFVRASFPKQPGDSDFVHRQAVRAGALDAVRGVLPAASLSNVGIYGTGQAYEALLLRMRAHPLPEARHYADLMLTELRKVIPSFLKRVDVADRGVATTAYLAENRDAMIHAAGRLLPDDHAAEPTPLHDPVVQLVDWDPHAEIKLIAAMLYPYTAASEHHIVERVRAMTNDERRSVVRAYVGNRTNRRHRPGRAFERTHYRFDILADYGAFRDLQRHRMLTIEWQPLSPHNGYTRPEAVEAAGLASTFDQCMERSARLYEALAVSFPAQAPYAVALAYRLRFTMQMNAREAMHLIELRTTPQGHPAYRAIAQQMHRLIAETAGHSVIADAMCFADHSGEPELGRLHTERRAEQRRVSR